MGAPPYKVICGDPPWPLKDKLPGKGRGAKKHYRLMSIDEICAFALPPIADDALLFMWRVASMHEEAVRVMRAWGFKPQKGEMVWVKTSTRKGIVQPFRADGQGLAFGMGRVVRGCHEVCLIGKRGHPVINDLSVRSVLFAPRGRHSAKPALFYSQVEKLCDGPRAELFARRRRPNWDSFGLELPEAPPPVMPRARRKREERESA